MDVITVDSITKTFAIPTVRRESVREHAFNLFRRRHFEQVRILNRVSFSVKRGETVGIMGRNGSGKSTLLKIICGIYRPDPGSGSVVVRGPLTPILELGVGWNPELTGVDNVYLLGAIMGLTLQQIREMLEDILAFAELERVANLELRHYSSGMSARLAYSVAFKAAKEILVLDEIFAVGDAGFKARCEEYYRKLSREGRTVLIVSHDINTITQFCDRAILIERGDIVMNDRPDRVADAYLDLLGSGEPATT